MSDRLDAAWNSGAPTTAARVLFAIGRALCVGFCYTWLRTTVEGREHIPRTGGFILAPVHRSNLDTPIAATTTRRPLRYMGKDSLWNGNKAMAWVLSALGGFPVARGTADRDALRRCQQILEDGQPLVLFPEGTRQFGPLVHELKDGTAFLAAKARVPIVPVGIGGSERVQQKGKKLIRPAKVHVVIGPPIAPPLIEGSPSASRPLIRATTAQLAGELQRLFDLAQARTGG